jgi:nucleotide-binding universal stress UspA family protein
MVSISRILCGIDFSEFSLDAIRHGLVLGQWYSAELFLLHVSQAPQLFMSRSLPGSSDGLVGADEDSIAEEVRRFSASVLPPAGQRMRIVVRPGDPAKEIRLEAERLPADLLILGTHGRSGFERLFLGSVTEKVLRSTRVPILTIPPSVREPGPPVYKTILCPLEFSDASIRALEHALSLAQAGDARLILLHVIEEVPAHYGAAPIRQLMLEYHEHLEREAVTRLKTMVPDEARVWSRPDERVVRGRAYEEILKVAADERVDVVVMGVRGTNALDRFVFGTTTDRVIRGANCPVLTLHSRSA